MRSFRPVPVNAAADRVLAGNQAAEALFEIASTSTSGPARLVRMFAS